MGITIHYKGSLRNISEIDNFKNEMAEICRAMNWEYRLWNEDQSKPFDATLVHSEKGAEIKGHIPLKGISIVIDNKNEGFDFLFNPDGDLSSFLSEILRHNGSLDRDNKWLNCKTQYGSVDSHIAVVKLLHHIKEKYIPDLKVIDEGKYWETNDKEHLMGKRAFLAGKIAQFDKALSSIEIEGEPSTEELTEKIEELFRKMQK